MKFLKLALAAFFISSTAFGQAQIPNNTVKLGGKNTANKDIIFDIDNGASNPRIRANGSTDKLQVSHDGSNYKSILGADDILTFGLPASGFNKVIEFDSGSGSANRKIRDNLSDSRLEFSNDGVNYKALGSGSGGGDGVNYIENGDGSNLTGWIGYADAAGDKPVDGTGGATTITFVSNRIDPLAGEAEFVLTKPASNVQGQGWSYNFSIDEFQQGRQLTVKIDYKVSAGTFYPASSNLDPSDLTIWFYDRCNNVLIEPNQTGFYNPSSADSINTTWWAATNCKDYRLILHQGTTSANTYTMRMTNVRVGTSKVNATLIDEIQEFSVYVASNGTVSKETGGDWINGNCTNTASPVCTFTTGWFGGTIPNCFHSIEGNLYAHGMVVTETTVTGAGRNSSDATAASDRRYFCRRVPGDPKYNAKIGARLYEPGILTPNAFEANLPGGSSAASNANFTGWTVNYNEGNNFKPSTGEYKVPVAGNYFFSFTFETSAANTTIPSFALNGSSIRLGTQSSSSLGKQLSAFIPGLKAGDVIGFRHGSGSTITLSSGGSATQLHRAFGWCVSCGNGSYYSENQPGVMKSGTYTPTTSGLSNVLTFTGANWSWVQIGDIVTVTGSFEMSHNSSAANFGLDVSLPVPRVSNFSSITQCGGPLSAFQTTGYVIAQGSTKLCNIGGYVAAGRAVNSVYGISFSYSIK